MGYYARPQGAAPRTAANRPNPPAQRSGCGSVLWAGLLFLVLTLLVFGGLLFGYVGIATGLPAPEELQARASAFASTQIYDREGNLLNEISDPNHGRRTQVKLDAISPYLVQATIATEDPNFYQHPGVDPVGIARAVYYAVRNRDVTSGPGGSTITQQLVKLTFLSAERTPSRKIKEAILATEITRRYSRDTILEIYLNEIFYGNLAYGIEAASETYFGVAAKDLDLAQAALLAGLPQAPAYYDPYTRLYEADDTTPGLVKQRQGAVLGLMVKHGSITAQQADAAWREPLKLRPLQQSYVMQHPHFVLYVRDQVEKVVGPELMAKGGLRIYATLDPRIQGIAEEEVTKQVAALARQGAGNAALVAVRPETGEVLAMVGSAGFDDEKISGQINMAVSPRQPGSSIKPLTYLAAFEMPPAALAANAVTSDAVSALEPPGYWTPSTAILDTRTQFPDGANPPYVPTNYDGKDHGVVTVRSALANSYNIPAVKALQHVGLDRLKEMATRLGITTLTRPDYGLSLTLGGGEVTLLELTGAYATLANSGVRSELSAIGCVIGSDGQVLWRGAGAGAIKGCQAAAASGKDLLVTPAPPQQVVDPRPVYLMTSILSDLEARRPAFGSSADLLSLPGRQSAAKTGTTNDYRDAWTMGYTPDLAVGVWVGNADYKPMQKLAGSTGAAPIWHNVMARSLEGSTPRPFAEPKGIAHVNVCADSGTLPSEACPAQRQEVFIAGREPLPARFDLHQRLRIDKNSGRQATEYTPADQVEVRDLMVFPPRYKAWAEAHGFPQITIEQTQYAFQPELALREPVEGSQLAGVVQIAGRAHLPAPLVWRLEYGVGGDPQGWGVVADPASGQAQDVDGTLANWDTAAVVARHHESSYTLRLAAYDPSNMNYPVAVSQPVHVGVGVPALEPSPTAAELPTAAPVPTETPLPTATPLPVMTRVVVLPTATPSPAPTRTEVPTTTPTHTPSPEPTRAAATPTPTATASPTEAPTATPTASPTPTTAAAEPTMAPTAAPTTAAAQAVDVTATIAQPAAGDQVSGPVAVTGVADGPGFQFYVLEYAPGTHPSAHGWQPVASPQAQPSSATGGLLGTWQTEALAPGPYTLRLTVSGRSGAALQTTVQVVVAAP